MSKVADAKLSASGGIANSIVLPTRATMSPRATVRITWPAPAMRAMVTVCFVDQRRAFPTTAKASQWDGINAWTAAMEKAPIRMAVTVRSGKFGSFGWDSGKLLSEYPNTGFSVVWRLKTTENEDV